MRKQGRDVAGASRNLRSGAHLKPHRPLGILAPTTCLMWSRSPETTCKDLDRDPEPYCSGLTRDKVGQTSPIKAFLGG